MLSLEVFRDFLIPAVFKFPETLEKDLIVTSEGAIHPKTLNVLAMSDIYPCLVEVCCSVVPMDT